MRAWSWFDVTPYVLWCILGQSEIQVHVMRDNSCKQNVWECGEAPMAYEATVVSSTTTADRVKAVRDPGIFNRGNWQSHREAGARARWDEHYVYL